MVSTTLTCHPASAMLDPGAVPMRVGPKTMARFWQLMRFEAELSMTRCRCRARARRVA